MLRELVLGFSWFALTYMVVLQLMQLMLAVASGVVVYRERITTTYGRVGDMLTSHLAPPVSIVVAAYNEAAGIVEAVWSMTMIKYPRLEIVVVNDGSTDDTLERLISAFKLVPVPLAVRSTIPTSEIRQHYRSTLPIELTVVDKVNGGRADALNAAANAARYPYVFATDADVIIDGDALIHAMRLFAADRGSVIGVGGQVRPINGCRLRHGHLVSAHVPERILERYQLLDYLRSFIGARPAWAALNCLPNISGAFGIFSRTALMDVGGWTRGHLGEDMDLTMRLHRLYRDRRQPYRISYTSAAVVWTEVPSTLTVLRRQRIRWHRGLIRAVKDFRSSFFNPHHGTVGMLSWPAQVLFEYVAPIVEALGYVVVPVAVAIGVVSLTNALAMFAIATLAGAVTSLAAIILDEVYGHFNDRRDIGRLLAIVFVENLGIRQMTVWWRIRAIFGRNATSTWGDMERRGVAQLAVKTR